ncbi:MAG: NAD(P)/FAD-dependent oxidoreductase [Coriobacteriales bacterium]|jgi:2,4-dienoyl-CoA reductase-like NADH-dependent reductase (Old Yellow Enzyme family)/NADPH-dependent 2,4-dienoyl-CoA reductase/sulfur reductase-like enzyme|nr:NAD(P)/FAD-dependent oxidoreductase [Coriobacteriales bacterium]
MERTYPQLCQPITLGRVTFRNRMFGAPLGATDITPDFSLGPRSQGFYELRAKGGAANVTVSELVVHPDTDASHMLHIGLATPGQLASFTYVADAISRHGAVPSIELSHSGQYAGTYLLDKNKKAALNQWGPSDGVRPDGLPVKALSGEQIAEIVAAYGEAAGLAKRAGFGMCLVHAGHGWLLNQFLSPWFNKRTDEYGGALENRLRIVREVLGSVRAAVGPGFPIELRMSGAELFDGGYDLAEGCRIAAGLEDLVDMLHISAGSYQFGFSVTHPPMFVEHGSNVYLAAEIKKHVSVPVATIGGLSDPAQMEQIIASGQADVVYMGRGLLADPELPNKVMANRGEECIRCLRCFVCMAERPVTQTRRCAINPRVGREHETMYIGPAARSRKVLVAGGGIAGMVAACTAADRGHQVLLCEATGELGGILRSEQGIPFKRDMFLLGESYARQLAAKGVEVRLATAVDAALVESEGAEALIVAVGSDALVPPLPGIDGGNVIIVNELYRFAEKVGQRVVVLGGGLSGCECALHLRMEGRDVTLVELRDELAPDANIRNRPILLAELEAQAVQVELGLTGVAVQPDGLLARNAAGQERLLPADTVICAVGQKSRSATVDALRAAAPWVRIIGDALRPATITKAVYEGYYAALDI